MEWKVQYRGEINVIPAITNSYDEWLKNLTVVGYDTRSTRLNTIGKRIYCEEYPLYDTKTNVRYSDPDQQGVVHDVHLLEKSDVFINLLMKGLHL